MKYFYLIVIGILAYFAGAVNSSPVPHHQIVLYNWCSLFGIGYVTWVTIKEWNK